ncbi:outer membrane protein assembly factor BamE [Pseudofrancisella aestuarii]|uniref:Outer membrane protein assembly factor BamE n=1 Tax=Pseudofrancisella aestuarii TaxID=2670347 RepID=A0ABV9TDB0_9GAMM|nr:outer membrane protein assembly factor BamE [Pseudofrancisella aestuarii]
MKKKYFIISLLAGTLTLSLSSCSWIPAYTAPVSQGKEFDNDKMLEIKPNMTKDEVKYLLGSPDIIDTFNPNQFIYVSTYKGRMQYTEFNELKLILTFNNQDRLVGISGNYAPPTKEPVF